VHEAVPLQRRHGLCVQLGQGAGLLGHEPQDARTTLAERPLEPALRSPWLVPAPARGAPEGKRADLAARYPRQADRGAEIHEGLAGAVRERLARPLLDTCDVRVDGQHRPAEGEARDGSRRVGPDSGKLRQVIRPAAVGDPPGGPVQADCAPVVAEALPGLDDVGQRSSGQSVGGRPAGEPCTVTGDDPINLRLLEHHLRDQDGVWIASPSPRKVATVLVEPGKESRLHDTTVEGEAAVD